MWSFARGCRAIEALIRRGKRGEERNGVAGRIDRFGSRAYGRGLDAMLRFAPVSESTSDCGPKEKVEPIECRGRELDGEGKFGTDGTAKLE